MGTGLDSVYPRENSRLVEEILKNGGAVMTKFPFGTPPLKDNFPYRNRMISGISHALVVVEATERSGSLITARLAMEQNREVMAVPGNITSRNSFGTNYLIKSGAKLVQQCLDVITELPRDVSRDLREKSRGGNEKKHLRPSLPAGCSDDAKRVWSSLSCDEERDVDYLVDATGFSVNSVVVSLLELEILGAVKSHSGNRYSQVIEIQ
jgi:DNA processing protein